MKREFPFYDVEYDFESVKDVISIVTETYKDNPVFKYKIGDKIVEKNKYEFVEHVQQIGNAIHHEFPQGTHIALLGKTSYNWISCFFAIMNSENVTVPLDKELPKEDILEQIDFADVKCLFYDSESSEVAKFVKENLAWEIKLFSLDNLGEKDNLPDFIEKYKSNTPWIGHPKAGDLAEIVFTSGTTGKSKGCMITHGNLAHNAMNGKSFVHLTSNDSALSILPINHTFEIAAGIMTPFCSGVTICINENLRQIPNNLNLFKPTAMIVVPLFVEKIHQRIWRTIKKKKMEGKVKFAMKLSRFLLKLGIDVRRKLFGEILDNLGGNLKLMVVGGAYMDSDIMKDFEAWGINIIEGYGVTECGPVISCNTDRYKKYGSVGKIVSGCEVKIVDDEILVKGPIVMQGYYKSLEETKEAFEGEWYKTGDLGRLDQDNFIYITGRKKNLIILANGKNVSPEELEQIVSKLDYVLEVVVFEKDNLIHAEVFLDKETYPNAAELLKDDIKLINESLPNFKRIAKTIIRDKEFEKTTTNKIKRTS